MAIITSTSKGLPLTPAEADANLTELDSRTAIKWQNLRSNIITDGISNAPPVRLFNNTLYMRAFSPTTEQEITALFHMPKDYIGGTDIYPHGHVCTETASTGVVRWGFTISWANEFESGGGVPASDQYFSTPQTFYVEQTVVATDQIAHVIVESASPLSIPALMPDSIILMRIFRDATHANDTYPDEISLAMVDFYYQSQGFGETYR